MAGQVRPGEISEPDFSSLLETLSATDKGRSFLAEYVRRRRPEETTTLLQALRRIEGRMLLLGEQLRAERVAEDISRIAMTLEIATAGATADSKGDETARRMALVNHASTELMALARALAGNVPHHDAGTVSAGANGDNEGEFGLWAHEAEDEESFADR